jgi:hypothetical protein
MDVHPPLAKLLITLAGWLAGFDGEFDFKDIGKDYLEPGVPYVAMRMLPAILGVLTVSLMFLTLKATGCRTSTAVMGAGLVIFGRFPKCHHIYSSNMSNWNSRQRADHSIPPDPVGLASRVLHCSDCVDFRLLYKPAGIGSRCCFQGPMVVLAGGNWCFARRHS